MYHTRIGLVPLNAYLLVTNLKILFLVTMHVHPTNKFVLAIPETPQKIGLINFGGM